ncbi:HNH endonuclease [Azospirillum brasilense]|uniref:HNH endonuclease n=1 Tax=Azospirillum brasilense TaxID=192 RepID=UPI002ED27B22|nr:HNH endonuclease [Azospirillum brasilense]
MTFGNFVRDHRYNRRRDLHDPYGGQRQGGIITPSKHPVIFAITGESGVQHGYLDGWTEDGQVFRYFGEGQEGDMTFTSGNKAIRDHVAEGEDLLLFQKQHRSGMLRFLGQFVCVSTSRELTPDRHGNMRNGIVFNLVPVEALQEADAAETEGDNSASGLDLAALRNAAMGAASTGEEEPAEGARRRVYQRSEVVRRYVLARAAGICECCKSPAPFLRTNGEPYLEPHHIRRVSDGGPDDPRYVAGVCPTCHRRIHHGADGKDINEALGEAILRFEYAVASVEPPNRTTRKRVMA